MKGSGVLLLIAFILPLLFIVHHSHAIEGDANRSPSVDKRSPVEGSSGAKMAPPDSVKADDDKRATDQDGASQERIGRENERDDPKESPGERKDENLEEPKAGKGNGKGVVDSTREHVEDSGVEECDSSNRCIDEKNKFVACLRVPGKDSLDLSLLVQNKGTESLDINIVAPGFVNLDQAAVQLQAKESKEVTFSVRDGANDTVIVLKAGEGNCTLNFRNMISDSMGKSETSASSGYIRLSTRSSLICIFLAAAALGGVVWLCIKFRRMHHQEGGPRYQKLELRLPVSTGGKKEADEAAGWDNSWGEGWDDEEAPMTPSKPVSNPSSKGLASRRSNKDGWKGS